MIAGLKSGSNDSLSYTDLLEGKNKVQIIIEMNREIRKRDGEAYPLVENDPLFAKMKEGVRKTGYLHFGYREYEFTMVEIADFAKSLHSKIKDEFEPVMLKLVQYFYPKHYLK